MPKYKSDTDVEEVVRGFETCTTLDSDFDHPAHLTVAFSYLHRSKLTVPEAADRMRAGLFRFLDHYEKDRQRYNETITRFWIKVVRRFLDRADPARPVGALLFELIESHTQSRLIYDYYTKERLSSEEARSGWVEPDVKPFDF